MLLYVVVFLVFMVLIVIGYQIYRVNRGKVYSEVEVADKKINNMYRDSDYDTAVVFQNLDL
jgi:hypothetical protein